MNATVNIEAANEDQSNYTEHFLHWTCQMVDLPGPKLLIQAGIHRPLLQLLAHFSQNPSTHMNFGILLSSQISSKISKHPELLPLFFLETQGKQVKDASLLFETLLNALHWDDHALGDVARNSILQLLHVMSPDFESFLIQSNLHKLLVCSLGGLFSQLSFRGETLHKEDMLHLIRFIKFYEQVLEQSIMPQFLQSLTKEFRTAFLDCLLLGSLLDSSDFDGSVSHYLEIFLRLIQITSTTYMAQIWTEFALRDRIEEECAEDPKISFKDFLFAKFKSLDDKVCCLSLEILSKLLRPPFSDYSLPLIFDFNPKSALIEQEQLETVKRLQLSRRFMNFIYLGNLSDGDLRDILNYSNSLSLAPYTASVNNKIASKHLEAQDILAENEVIDFLLYKLKTRFFKNSSEVNLRLTQVISQIGALPSPPLIHRLFSGDAFDDDHDSENQFDSLYTILSQLCVESPHVDKANSMNQRILHEFTKESLAIYLMHS